MMRLLLSLFLLICFVAQAHAGFVMGRAGGSSGGLLVGDATSYTGGTYNINANYMMLFRAHTLPYEAVGTGDIATCYARIGATDANDQFKLCVFEDADGDGCSDGDCDLLGCSDEIDGATAGLQAFTFSSTIGITTGHYYLLGLIPATGDYVSVAHDGDGVRNWHYDAGGTYASPRDPWTYSGIVEDIGEVTIYCEE